VNAKGVVLVVDDTPESLVLLTDILRAEGFDVRPADSGELALAATAAIRPELILLDIRMPGMNGFEVCRILKEREETREIPIIFISATADTGERLEGWRLGAVDFVSKPFDKQELMARVATRLELSRLQKRLEQMVAERTASLQEANRKLRAELAERIRAEEALRESEARFRSLANTVAAVIWTSGPDTVLDFFNQYATDFTGRAAEKLAGNGWQEVMHPEDRQLRYPAFRKLIAAHVPYQAEYRARRADGEYRWLLDTATPRFIGEGGFAGYVGIAIDITDLKRNQEQLLATQKLESLGVLVSGVAHRFNNLMGTIIAEADLAASDIPQDSPAYDSVSHINTTAMKVSEIVALLSAYAGGSANGPVAPVSVSQVVEETHRLFMATSLIKVPVTVDVSANLPLIRADISQIRQVVMNLLTNACEAIQGHDGAVSVLTSRMTVRIGEEQADQRALPPGEYVRLEVTDTGCGIAEAARPRIFDPFYSTRALGRGLGLAAVQGIVRSLGGAIRVQSAVNRGSTFEVLVPALQAEPADLA
jgi:PAS domain S-box-containing protein